MIKHIDFKMGIDIQQYRTSIGNFIAKNIPFKSCKEQLENMIKRRKQNLFQMLLKFMLLIALVFALNESTSLIHIEGEQKKVH